MIKGRMVSKLLIGKGLYHHLSIMVGQGLL